MDIYLTYSVFTKFFLSITSSNQFFLSLNIISIDYFLFIAIRIYKYLFLGIFIICKQLFKLFFNCICGEFCIYPYVLNKQGII